MAVLYLTFGPTHSGKTTFGEKLFARLSKHKAIRVDNDAVENFLKENFDNLRTDPEVLRTRTPTNPDLRLKVPQLIVGYALSVDYHVVVTASHSKKVIRQNYSEIAAKNGAKVILLLFKTSESVIRERLQRTEREDLSLHVNSFTELYEKQQNALEYPSIEEKAQYYKVFEIDENNADSAMDELVREAG